MSEGREVSALCHALIEGWPGELIVSDPKGGLILQNELSRTRVGELPFGTSVLSAAFGNLDEEESAEMRRSFAQAQEAGRSVFRFHHSNLSLKATISRLVTGALTWTIQDVTEEWARELLARTNAGKLEVALAATGLALWSWDLKTNEVIWDKRMYQLTGVVTPLTLPEWIETLTHPDDRTEIRRLAEQEPQLGPSPPSISRFIRPDGQESTIVSAGSVMAGDDGRPRFMIGGLLDVSEQAELAALAQKENKRQTLGRITRGVAHNFNNMLMIIEPCLEALEDVVPDSHLPFIQDAAEAGQRSSEIVRQLMTVGDQRDQGARAPCSFSNLCEQAVATCRRESPQELRLEFFGHSDSRVDCAPGAIEQVLVNLLLNAKNAVTESHRPEGLVAVQLRDVDEDGKKWVEFVVSDNGPGISEEAQTKIFEPFFTTRSGAGTGLGLATSQAIVRQHGGKLACQSSEGAGTQFSLRLPTVSSETHTPSDPVMENTKSERIKVLVVDDEAAICRIVTHTLERNGFDAASVSDPAQVESVLSEGTFHIILLDRSMGTTKGSSLLPLLRDKAPHAKVLYFTGEFVEPAEQATVDGIVQKPINGRQLTETLRQVL